MNPMSQDNQNQTFQSFALTNSQYSQILKQNPYQMKRKCQKCKGQFSLWNQPVVACFSLHIFCQNCLKKSKRCFQCQQLKLDPYQNRQKSEISKFSMYQSQVTKFICGQCIKQLPKIFQHRITCNRCQGSGIGDKTQIQAMSACGKCGGGCGSGYQDYDRNYQKIKPCSDCNGKGCSINKAPYIGQTKYRGLRFFGTKKL